MENTFSFPLWGLRGLDTKAQRHEVFLFRAKLAKEQRRKAFFETQIHEVFLLKKVANEWKILSASPLGD